MSMQEYVYDEYPWESDEKDNSKYWEIGGIQELEFANELQKRPSFARCFNKRYDITWKFFQDLRNQTRGENHVIITIVGRTGMGKSRVAQVIARMICPRITIKDIVFTDEELLSRTESVPPNHCLIKDEHVIQHGIGSEREKGEVMNIEMIMRKYGLSLIFCSPVEFPHDTAHFRFKVLCVNKTERKTKVGVLDAMGTYLGYIVIDIPEDKDDPLWTEYNGVKGKKNEFIGDAKGRNLKRLSFKDLAFKVRDHELYKKWNGNPNASTLFLIIRDQNANLADKEVTSIFTAYCNWVGKPRVDKADVLSMADLQKLCPHKPYNLHVNAKTGKVSCMKCKQVLS